LGVYKPFGIAVSKIKIKAAYKTGHGSNILLFLNTKEVFSFRLLTLKVNIHQ